MEGSGTNEVKEILRNLLTEQFLEKQREVMGLALLGQHKYVGSRRPAAWKVVWLQERDWRVTAKEPAAGDP